jgi:uncharacterized RDD family membrane protein YckC
MSAAVEQNRFAPPRAQVGDQADGEAVMVAAGRGARFLAVLIDGVLPMILGFGVLAAIAIPAYQHFQQSRTPGIEPPAPGGSHLLLAPFATIGGLLIVGYLVYNVVLVYLYGQTFGKRLMNIRVVRMDGSRVAFSRFIFLRWLPVTLLSAIPVVGGLVALLDPLLIFRESSRCLHDDIADTRVVTAASSVDATLRGDAKYAGANLRTISF